MKAGLTFKRRVAGSTLAVTLVLCSILSLSIFGYLSLVEQQSKLSNRSQAWNAAIAIVEAGIEEGMEHLNCNFPSLASDGWTGSSPVFSVSNVLAGGSAYVTIINTADPLKPEITCQAYVASSAFSTLAAIAVACPQETISRKVRVRCSRPSLFIKALAAKEEIDMNGNNIMADSFDSGDPLYSTGGLYDPAKTGDKGDVASNLTLKNSINVGNANIYGHVATGPNGTVAIGPNGGVGSHAWQAANVGFQPGWVSDDSNFTFPDTTAPYNKGLTPASGNIVEPVQVYTTNNVTSASYPGYMPWGGMGTNLISTINYTTYPNPPPAGLYTNIVFVETSIPPSPSTAGVVTNESSVTSSTYPTGLQGSVTTNSYWTNVLALPNPIPAGLVTNTTLVGPKEDYPAPGTYFGQIITNKYSGKQFYSYGLITGYSFPYNIYTFTIYSYNYPTYTYHEPVYSYNYNTYITNTIYQTNYYDQILYSGKYYMNSILTGKTIVLGKAELVCQGIDLSGSDILKIGQNGSLTNWVSGKKVSISGNGVVNLSGKAANYVCLCDSSVKTLDLEGNGEFVGVMVAPEAVTQLNGGGSGVMDFIGSLMVFSAKLNGHYRFHYDEALGRMGGNGRFLITSWDELPIN